MFRRAGLQAARAPGVATILPRLNLGLEALVFRVMVWLPSVSVTPRIGGEGSRGGAMRRAVTPPTREPCSCMANGAGRGLTGCQHRPDSATPHPPGEQLARARNQGREPPRRSDHPIWAGGIQYEQQLLQHRSHRRAALRVVHRREDPRRDAGLDLLQADRAVHQQLGADIGGRQRHGQDATAYRVPSAGQQGQRSEQGLIGAGCPAPLALSPAAPAAPPGRLSRGG
jgi:hypothetical protein